MKKNKRSRKKKSVLFDFKKVKRFYAKNQKKVFVLVGAIIFMVFILGLTFFLRHKTDKENYLGDSSLFKSNFYIGGDKYFNKKFNGTRKRLQIRLQESLDLFAKESIKYRKKVEQVLQYKYTEKFDRYLEHAEKNIKHSFENKFSHISLQGESLKHEMSILASKHLKLLLSEIMQGEEKAKELLQDFLKKAELDYKDYQIKKADRLKEQYVDLLEKSLAQEKSYLKNLFAERKTVLLKNGKEDSDRLEKTYFYNVEKSLAFLKEHLLLSLEQRLEEILVSQTACLREKTDELFIEYNTYTQNKRIAIEKRVERFFEDKVSLTLQAKNSENKIKKELNTLEEKLKKSDVNTKLLDLFEAKISATEDRIIKQLDEKLEVLAQKLRIKNGSKEEEVAELPDHVIKQEVARQLSVLKKRKDPRLRRLKRTMRKKKMNHYLSDFMDG